MFNSFIISFKLKNTYRVNSIIYSIKQLPIIKKVIPSTLYKSDAIKILGNIISILMELSGIFVGKLIYIFLMIVLELGLLKTGKADTFLHIFTFLTLCGGILNTFMFNPSRDKYYAMILMNMDAKEYTLSNYYYNLINCFIGFLPFTLIFGLISGIPYEICLMMPLFVVMIKLIASCYNLIDYKKNRKTKNENIQAKKYIAIVGILLLLAYGLPFIGVVLNQTIFLIALFVSVVLGIYSFNYINKFDKYRQMYKEILTPNNIFAFQAENQSQILQTATLKQIELNTEYTSNKKGLAYLHDIFIKRHRKIITKSAKRTALISAAIILGMIIATQFKVELKQQVNSTLLVYLPYFVFVMYMINKGPNITQAMFMNCDHSMLTYKVYKTPKVILRLFKERLKTLIKINLLPAIVIAIGLPIILFTTGGTENLLNYIVLFVAIISMSVFFSVHYLTLYYLLQPYNVNIEMKSSTYSLAQMATYIAAYAMMKLQLPIISFGIATVIFSILYCLISLGLVYKFAPKTFKLRI